MSIKISNIFSETRGPIRVRFYVKHLCLTGTKVYIIGPGYMTKMAAMPIYGKTLRKSSSPEPGQRALKLNRQQKDLEPYNIYINEPGLT